MKRILHTEASLGWGGQERRILHEALGLRKRGYMIYFAVAKGAELAKRASKEGFIVYEIPLKISQGLAAFYHLTRIIRRHQIEMINTHSSSDSWLAGITGKLLGIPVLRTRHLSTPIKKGLNAKLLYNSLAQATVTTCEDTARRIRLKAGLEVSRCRSVPTGTDLNKTHCSDEEVSAFKKSYGLTQDDLVIGTVCVLRSWKGILDILEGAKLLSNRLQIKWVIVGSGPGEKFFKERCKTLDLEDKVIFTGHMENPFPAIASFDIFTLLSTGHEGVSQASLQAAYFSKPLITTNTGGLPEVCIEGKTGMIVPKNDPKNFALAVEKLAGDPSLRKEMGRSAHQLVVDHFSLEKTLNEMEEMILSITSTSKK